MRTRLFLCAGLVAIAVLTGCAQYDIARIAGDATEGRNNDTPGSALARSYILGELKGIGNGLDSSKTGDDAYLQTFTAGTNLLAVIPGTDLADQYVMVGAHYDHLGRSCRTSDPADTICNGATDNAAGVAALLGIARAIKAQPTPPRRSVILAVWDREEDGLLGSQYYTQHPVVPLAKTVGYVNFDIQGSNLLPSLRNTSFAVASETGGTRLQDIVRSAIGEQSLDTSLFSSIFGQFRSDYAMLINAGVPSVFFTDSTGPCYHTAQDDPKIVDFYKLEQQTATALSVTRELAGTSTPPIFAANAATATFDDAVVFSRVVNRAYSDRGRFSQADQDTFTRIRNAAQKRVDEGRAQFGSDDVAPLLGDAVTAVNLLTRGTCDGFLVPSQQAAALRRAMGR